MAPLSGQGFPPRRTDMPCRPGECGNMRFRSPGTQNGNRFSRATTDAGLRGGRYLIPRPGTVHPLGFLKLSDRSCMDRISFKEARLSCAGPLRPGWPISSGKMIDGVGAQHPGGSQAVDARRTDGRRLGVVLYRAA